MTKETLPDFLLNLNKSLLDGAAPFGIAKNIAGISNVGAGLLGNIFNGGEKINYLF